MKSGYCTDNDQIVYPDSIKLPGLCEKCAKNGMSDEAIPCNLNRIDQAKGIVQGKAFICGAYKPKRV